VNWFTSINTVAMDLKLMLMVFGLISNSTGDDIAKRLKKRYNSVKEKCSSRGKDRPAYECSGIMIRGVNNNVQLAWGMKDMNKQKDGFSLAFLRKDQVFSKFPFNYDSGFIIYPHLKTPKKKNTYKVFCSFPMDGWTDAREGHGCGKSGGDVLSSHCHKQNIKSYNDWKSHFVKIQNIHLPTKQCAFDMTKKSAAKYFAVSLKANRYIQKRLPQFAFTNNELKMHAWSVKKAKKIPIEAFFLFVWLSNWETACEKTSR